MANEQPNPLPATLPAGTRWKTSSPNDTGAFLEVAKLGGDYYEGQGKRDDGRVYLASVRKDYVCWESLPASPAPPPDVAAPGDRLFEGPGQCCLCGGPAVSSPGGSRTFYCHGSDRLLCRHHWADRGTIDEIGRRRALQTPPAPESWEPRVGEMCEGIGHPNGQFSGQVVRGTYVRECTSDAFAGGCILRVASGDEPAVTRASLRPAPPSAAPEFYGTQPSELPETLAPAVAKVDPYNQSKPDMEMVWIKNDARRAERIAALSLSANPLDRLAARRAKQVGTLLGEMSRPDVSTKRHPSDWTPPDDFETFPRVRKIGDE